MKGEIIFIVVWILYLACSNVSQRYFMLCDEVSSNADKLFTLRWQKHADRDEGLILYTTMQYFYYLNRVLRMEYWFHRSLVGRPLCPDSLTTTCRKRSVGRMLEFAPRARVDSFEYIKKLLGSEDSINEF